MPTGIKIIGIGNPLMGDDGLGIAVVALLMRQSLPSHVEVIDGGTGGISLLHLLEGADQVLFIDAVDIGATPGSISIFDVSDIGGSNDNHLSLHQTGLPQVLALARELGPLPDIFLYGVQPESVQPRQQLSAAITSALPRLVERVLAHLDRQ